jgi:hypothetical protein
MKLLKYFKMAKSKTSSPQGGDRACLCADGTYSKDCCNGELINQGIGSLVGQNSGSTIVNTNEPRTIVSVN